MIICTKPEHYIPHNSWELEHEKGEQPVIVVLDPRKVFTDVQASDYAIGTDTPRFSRAMNLAKWDLFELPDVRGAWGSLKILQGRHRTGGAAGLGLKAYPVVTTDEDAPWLLERFGAPRAEAARIFDWSAITDYAELEAPSEASKL